MVTVEEFDFMMDCWERVHKRMATTLEVRKAIRIAERLIYDKESCLKRLDGIQQRTILYDLGKAEG